MAKDSIGAYARRHWRLLGGTILTFVSYVLLISEIFLASTAAIVGLVGVWLMVWEVVTTPPPPDILRYRRRQKLINAYFKGQL